MMDGVTRDIDRMERKRQNMRELAEQQELQRRLLAEEQRLAATAPKAS
jgi:hypothetical protein